MKYHLLTYVETPLATIFDEYSIKILIKKYTENLSLLVKALEGSLRGQQTSWVQTGEGLIEEYLTRDL